MAEYILTYDIPNERRPQLEQALRDHLHATPERGVSTVWRFTNTRSAAEIRDALRADFPTIKAYVYEVKAANSATTEARVDPLLEAFLLSRK